MSPTDRRKAVKLAVAARPDWKAPKDETERIINAPAASYSPSGQVLSEDVAVTVEMVRLAEREHLDLNDYRQRSQVAVLVAKQTPDLTTLRHVEQQYAQTSGR